MMGQIGSPPLTSPPPLQGTPPRSAVEPILGNVDTFEKNYFGLYVRIQNYFFGFSLQARTN